MSFINYSSREIHCKIVFYGPGQSGKTASLRYIYETSNPSNRGNLVSLSDPDNRTLFFDFLPIDLGEINSFKTRLHLYTIPGQIVYESGRKLILKGVDGLIFVADSASDRLEANLKSLESLNRHLADYGYESGKLPMVFQYNKRDKQNILPVSEISRHINITGRPEFESVATKGTGIYDTLKMISKMVLNELKGGTSSV